MRRTIAVAGFLLAFAGAQAQPGPQPFPLPFPSIPRGWATLRLNSDQPPSCVFGNFGTAGAQAYFCAVIVKAPAFDSNSAIHGFNGGAIAGILVDPASGNVTETSPLLLSRTQPRTVTCVTAGNAPECLFFPGIAPSGAPALMGIGNFGGGTAALLTPPAVPTFAGGSSAITGLNSNISCVSWGTGNASCFALDVFANIRQWSVDSGTWSTPTLNGSGFTGPQMPMFLQNGNTGFWSINCTSSSAAGSATPQFDCFGAAKVVGPGVGIGNLVRARTAGTSVFSASNGWSWAGSALVGGASLVLGTAPECLSANAGRSDCFFGFASGNSLGSVPDNGAAPAAAVHFVAPVLQGGLLQGTGKVQIPASCVSFGMQPAAGSFECAYDYNGGADASNIPQGNFANATIWHAVSAANFWVESLGVAAPTQELQYTGHFPRVVSNPKAVKSLTCTRGADFQSLCVASIVESNPNPFAIVTSQGMAFEIKKYRLAFRLVGAVGAPPAPPPPVPLVPLHPHH